MLDEEQLYVTNPVIPNIRTTGSSRLEDRTPVSILRPPPRLLRTRVRGSEEMRQNHQLIQNTAAREVT